MTTDRDHDVPNRVELDALFRSDPLAATLGATLADWGPGWAECGLDAAPDHANFAGSVHGGVLFSLADLAFAVACNSYGRQCVALSIDAQFLAAARVGDTLVATASEQSRGRATGSYELKVRRGERLVASLHALCYRTDGWHLGEDAWPTQWRLDH